MSSRYDPGRGRRGRWRSVLAVLGAGVTITALAGAGSLLGAQSATFRPTPIALVGKTSTVCTVAPASAASSTSIATVVIRQAPGRPGRLTGTPVGGSTPDLSLTEQGLGQVQSGRTTSELLVGEGVMATASSGEVFGLGTSGEQQGLMAAPCLTPGTEHWFVGVGAEAEFRSELVLTNPDDAQAEVDLQYFGADGELVVAGSPGLVVEAHDTRTVALEPLVSRAGPLTVSVRATTGRVAAVARDLHSAGLDPAGADWHVGSVAPARELVIPAVPEGAGARELLVANPGPARAEVTVEVLAQTGPFAPVGGERVEVPPQSTASVNLAPGLVGQSGAVRLVSTVPVTGAVRSTSLRAAAAPDTAVQPATAALVRTGVVALAVPGRDRAADPERTGGVVESELLLSNGSDGTTTASFEVLSHAGVSLQRDDVLLGGYATSTRRLRVDGPAYVVVKVLDGSDVRGGVVYTQPEGDVAGLAGVPLTSPDIAGRAPAVVFDPSVGR